MKVDRVKNILVHGKLNILTRELKKEWVCNGLQEDMFIMDNLKTTKDMVLE